MAEHPDWLQYITVTCRHWPAARVCWSRSMTAILPDWSESDRKAVRDQLDRIVKSGAFHQSRRRQRFLEYIVNETLAGRGELLKGYNIALAVFDRTDTFDSNVDPIVRMRYGRGPKGLIAAELKPDNAPGPSSH